MATTGFPYTSKSSVGRVVFLLSFLVFFTALLDLFVNRLLFRAGPEMLAHIDIPGMPMIAEAGRISFTFEQLALYFILGGVAVALFREGGALPRYLSMLVALQLATAALLYAPVELATAWALSMALVVSTLALVLGFLWFGGSHMRDATPRQDRASSLFLILLGLAFVLPLAFRVSVMLSSVGLSTGFLGILAYDLGIYAVMAAAAAAFLYALSVSSPGFKMGVKNLVKAAAIPTLLVVPMLFGLTQSFLMVQILSMVIAMSTDMTLSFSLVQAIVAFWWFLLTAIFLLILKGRSSGNRFLIQQAIGLVFILSTTFLFNYPNYLLLGTAGVALLTYRLTS